MRSVADRLAARSELKPSGCIAAEFNMSTSQISNIRNNRHWRATA